MFPLINSSVLLALLLLPLAPLSAAQASQPAQKPAVPQGSTDELYEMGKALFDQYAPEEVKRDYEFPSKQQWDVFVVRLQKALEGDSMEDLASMEPEARAALRVLELWPEGGELADWLRERLDMIEAAREISKAAAVPQKTPVVPPVKPGVAPKPVAKIPPKVPVAPSGGSSIPNYDFWMTRLRARPAPEQARALMPILGKAFTSEDVANELAWIAEVESTFNPSARSPSGAKGLFQLMPDTAKGLGLSTWMPDERSHPEKSARAAARLLHGLYTRLGDWPLALAAYNAGEGRVRRTLEKKGAKSFQEIASSLPVETRLYVPKVLATVSTRTGLSPEKLAALKR